MASSSDLIALIDDASDRNAIAPSKRPPPLPAPTASSRPPADDSSVVELFFQEVLDGDVESLPPSGPYPFPLGEPRPLAHAGTDATPALRGDEWLEPEAEVEDPARTRRRRTARIGVAWGAVAMLAVAGVAAFVGPRREPMASAWHASPPPVLAAASAPVAAPIPDTPPGPGPAPVAAAVTAPPPPARATTRATTASASPPAAPRAVARKRARSSPAKRPASKSPKASGAHSKRPPAEPAAPARPGARRGVSGR